MAVFIHAMPSPANHMSVSSPSSSPPSPFCPPFLPEKYEDVLNWPSTLEMVGSMQIPQSTMSLRSSGSTMMPAMVSANVRCHTGTHPWSA